MSDKRKQNKWARFDGNKASGSGKKPVTPKAKFGVTAGRREEGPGKFLLVATTIVLGVAGAVALTYFLQTSGADPHYTAATTMLANYEDTRSPDRRNYGSKVYSTALDELALVDPESKSADAARLLDHNIRKRIAEFQARLRAGEQEKQQNLQARREKQEIVYQRRLEARANPRTTFPECESVGKDGHAGHSHSH